MDRAFEVDGALADLGIDLTEAEYAQLLGACLAGGAPWARTEGLLRRMGRELTTLQARNQCIRSVALKTSTACLLRGWLLSLGIFELLSGSVHQGSPMFLRNQQRAKPKALAAHVVIVSLRRSPRWK